MVPARAPRVYLHLGAVVLGAVLRTRSDAERDLELLAQRHQVTILSRQVHRPELIPADRLILAAVGRRLLAGRLLFLTVHPAALASRDRQDRLGTLLPFALVRRIQRGG